MNNQRVALVSGANRGIGKEIARLLAEQGIRVIATSRDDAKGKSMVESLQASGLPVSTFPLEVTDEQSRQALIDYIRDEFGRLDILVNNAAIAVDYWSSGWDIDIDLIRQTMEVNVYAPLRMMQLVIPFMKEQQYGRIVNMSSELASNTAMQMGNTVAYRCAKATLNSLTRLLALELKDYQDILINAAAPGWCRTELGGEDADRSAEEGADTPVWLATLPSGGPTGGFFRDRESYPW